jgi:ABC-type Zn uptake system ZnuABC Zn-binding protein ZnuA
MIQLFKLTILAFAALALSACSPASPPPAAPSAAEPAVLNVLATAPFLADIAQNVAGDRFAVGSLIPQGVDSHAFEPSPSDVARVASSQVLIINGGGLETFIDNLLENAGGSRLVIEAAQGLEDRTEDEDHEGEEQEGEEHEDEENEADDHGHEGDPHFWLDPNLVVQYVLNIRDGFIQFDPQGAEEYTANAEKYIQELQELDRWIASQVDQIPAERRLMVTNHESFGYFADRYGLTVLGAVVSSSATGASPSARELAGLIDLIRTSGAPAIFLETGANPRLAEQIAAETGITIAPELYSHSTSATSGSAPSYIEMMKYNTGVIVDALK